MNLYDEEPRPFWEREEEEPVAVAPPPVPEGGWKTLEDIPDEDIQMVAAPAVPAGGWKTLEDIPDEVELVTPGPKLPKMEVPEGGFKSLSEIPEEVELEAETPKTTDASKWDDEDRAKWKALPSHQREIFLREQNERDLFNDLRSQRAALRDEEFKPPENWASLAPAEKTRLQEEFSKNKDVFLRSFDTAATEQGHADIINRLRGAKVSEPMMVAGMPLDRDELIGYARAAAFSPTRGVWDTLSGLSNTIAHSEAKLLGIKPEDTFSHKVAVAGREATRDLVGEKSDTLYSEVLRGLGTTLTFAPAAMLGGNKAVAAQGALTSFGDGYFEAKEMARMQGREASEPESYARAFAAAGIGASEGIPLARGLDRLEKVAGKGIIGRIIAMGKEGAEEWVQEYGANVMQDTYDKLAGLTGKDWTDILTNVGGPNVAGFTGFLTALLLQGAQITAGRSRVPKVATVPPPGAPATGAPPPIVPPATTAVPPPPGVPPVVPPVVPPAAGAVVPPVIPPAAVPPVIPPVTPVTPVPPVLKTPEAIEPGVNTPAGAAVTQEVGAENLAVKEVADTQAQKLQTAGAPKTAEAIQQVASRSNAGATVSAADFLEQAKTQAAEAAVAAAPEVAAPPAAAGAPAPVTPVAAPPVAAAPAPVTPPAIPAIPAAPPAAAAPQFAPPAAVPAPAAPAAPAAPTAAPQTAVVVGGQVFTGDTHEDAVRAAHTAVGADAMRSAEGGWVDPDTGRFVSHGIYQAHQALNAAIEEAGGNMEAPGVQEAGAQLAEAQARDIEINNQIVQPGGEQVVTPGIKGQEALVATRPSQELAVPLAGVTATIQGVNAQGRTTTAQRPAAQALNDARNDRTALTILLDCLI